MKHILFLTFILWAGICKANDIKITVENSLMDGSPTHMQLICIAKWFKLNRKIITGVIRYSIKTVDRKGR